MEPCLGPCREGLSGHTAVECVLSMHKALGDRQGDVATAWGSSCRLCFSWEDRSVKTIKGY